MGRIGYSVIIYIYDIDKYKALCNICKHLNFKGNWKLLEFKLLKEVKIGIVLENNYL